ncbi:MAG TPA: outer membrane beta-barrel family protein [Flavitalea sp.]|nr:outer membrane beta-barrel family protein [Flavitalea sp.]
MKQLFTLICLLLLILSSFAQTTVRISGRVTDPSANPLNGATISLLSVKDSSLVKIYASDKNGRYELENLLPGKYLLAVSAVGHSKSYSSVFEVQPTGASIQMEPIILRIQSKDLKEVVVVSNKPMVEMKMDRMVVNVDAAVSNVGATVLEVLEKSPGVQVDKDGNISLKGKQGVIVMLDGRPSYLGGAELANLLKGMQATQVDQIEIMTNPPAKYDAAGNSGIINIKTKKNKISGFNGSVTAGYSQGKLPKTNENVNVNYRNGKVNLFANYSFSNNKQTQQLDIYRRYKNADKSTNAIFEQTSVMNRNRTNNNLKLGMDYYLNKKTTIGIVLSGFYNPGREWGHNTSFLKNPDAMVDSIVEARSNIEDTWKNFSANVNVRRQFDSAGRELSVDVDYVKYAASNSQYFINTTYTPDWERKYDEQLQGHLPVDINIYSAKADYTHPLKKGSRIEFGWKSSYVTTDSKANYFEFNAGMWETDLRKTNFFDYKENVNAAYVSYNRQLTEKLGLQSGLRFENTNYDGHQYGNPTKGDSSFRKSYNSLFPTIYLSYGASKIHQFGLSFGRRIDRPAYQDLNPFLFFLDKYTYGAGNPYLKPQYSNNFEFSHIYKSFLTTTLNYSITNNLFTEVFDQDGYATIVREGNIGRRENAGIAVNAQITVTKWYTSMVYTNYNYSKFSGVLYGDPISVEAGNLTLNVNNQLKFKKGWSAELSGWYRSKGVEGQMVLQPMGAVTAGISKQLWKGKGTVRLNMRDIFYTQVAHGSINFKSTEAKFTNTRDSRVGNITFTYRFGKPMNGNGNGQRKKSGGVEEQNRVKSGE